MSGCHLPNQCTKHNVELESYMGYWKCPMCNYEQLTSILSQRTCKCHVSQSECCYICMTKMSSIKFATEKEETITIKKVLWDEMREYKKKVDLLIHQDKTDQHWKEYFFDALKGRIEKLELDIDYIKTHLVI